MTIDNIQKTQTQRLWQSGIELAKKKPDISGFMQSYPDKVVWNLYAIDQGNHSKMVLEKSKVLSLGKCIKCHVYKQKYHVCLPQFF